MSPRQPDPAVRTALIEEAARLIAEEGRDALTLRRLTGAVGVSTMAVYTHFGSMDDLRRAVRQEGFDRLAAHQDAAGRTGDPVADLLVMGMAYYANATANPDLYRAMFMDASARPGDALGLETFDRLVTVVARCSEAGRIRPPDPTGAAVQFWAAVHGIVSLLLTGFLDGDGAVANLREMSGHLLVALGDEPADIEASQAVAARRSARLRTGPAGGVASTV